MLDNVLGLGLEDVVLLLVLDADAPHLVLDDLVDLLLLLSVTVLAGGLLLPLALVVWVTALTLVHLVQLGEDLLEVLPVLLGEPHNALGLNL